MIVRELVRARSRFLAVGAALTLIAVLVLLLGGLLDGLVRGSTGLLRAQDGDLIVYASDARDAIERSVLSADEVAAIGDVAGVASIAPFATATVTAFPAGVDPSDEAAEPFALALVGHEDPIGPVGPPGDATAVADARIGDAGIEVGDALDVPGGTELTVTATIDDVAFAGAPTLWVPLETFRAVVADARPDNPIGADGVNVVAVGVVADGDPYQVADAIDDALGSTRTLTVDDAIAAIPGVEQQSATFLAIIAATLVVAGLVVALFFALLTLERTPLYAVLKALGASTGELARGVALQAALVAIGAAALGGVLTMALAAIVPDGVPVELLPGRAATAAGALVGTAVLGAAASLRRLTRIDPAEAIG